MEMSTRDPGADQRFKEEALRLTGELGCLIFMYNAADPSNLLRLTEAVQIDAPLGVNPVSTAQEALQKMELDEGQKVAIVEKWKLLMDVHKGKLEELVVCKQVAACFQNAIRDTPFGAHLYAKILETRYLLALNYVDEGIPVSFGPSSLYIMC